MRHRWIITPIRRPAAIRRRFPGKSLATCANERRISGNRGRSGPRATVFRFIRAKTLVSGREQQSQGPTSPLTTWFACDFRTAPKSISEKSGEPREFHVRDRLRSVCAMAPAQAGATPGPRLRGPTGFRISSKRNLAVAVFRTAAAGPSDPTAVHSHASVPETKVVPKVPAVAFQGIWRLLQSGQISEIPLLRWHPASRVAVTLQS